MTASLLTVSRMPRLAQRSRRKSARTTTTRPSATPPQPVRARTNRTEPPMRLAHFFIDRPRFATVLSAFVTLLGLGALAVLPVAQYPEVVPPTVQITATYPG